MYFAIAIWKDYLSSLDREKFPSAACTLAFFCTLSTPICAARATADVSDSVVIVEFEHCRRHHHHCRCHLYHHYYFCMCIYHGCADLFVYMVGNGAM